MRSQSNLTPAIPWRYTTYLELVAATSAASLGIAPDPKKASRWICPAGDVA